MDGVTFMNAICLLHILPEHVNSAHPTQALPSNYTHTQNALEYVGIFYDIARTGEKTKKRNGFFQN